MRKANSVPISVITGSIDVLQGVTDDDGPLAQPLGPRRADVVLPQHLEAAWSASCGW